MIEVIIFHKPCPHCKEILFPVQKMSASWLECRNEKCGFLADSEKSIDGEAFPFSCCYNRR